MRTLASRESADYFSWRVALEWKLEDCWVGVFWKRGVIQGDHVDGKTLDIWICLLPCLPIHLTFRRLS